MRTIFMLMAQYNGLAIIPLDMVARDYFPHLKTDKLLQKICAGDIAIPLTRIESSQKAARGIHVEDLAKYIEARRAEAVKECEQLNGKGQKC